MPLPPSFKHIIAHWDLSFRQLRPDIIISGSPERTAFRTVVEDETGCRWLLEKITRHQQKHKIEIIHLINQLDHAGYQYVTPYLPTPEGIFQIEHASDVWQIVPFIEGVALSRPAYAFEKWRGPLIAKGLLDLKSACCSDHASPPSDTFSIANYVIELTKTIEIHNSELMAPLRPIVNFLESFFSIHDALPDMLCHGDYHPINIIWGHHNIRTIIDWEFFGLKPEAYDLANMLGCLGMEDPASLYGSLVMSLLEELKAAQYMEERSWQYLLDLMLSIRFGWLSEWLRKDDVEMIRLELTYMYLLKDHYKEIQKKWKIA
jgi:homoserine kinase type II